MKTDTSFTVVITILILTCLVTSGTATVAPYRIRPIIHIKSSLFEGDAPMEVLCLVVKSLISNDYVSQI